MIERTIVNGRRATVAYIDGEWEPTDRAHATMMKVIFDDNSEVAFLSTRIAQIEDKDWDESKHPRGKGGKWVHGAGGGEDEGEHPGEGYSKKARVINGVIHTTEVEDAARALTEHRKVELDQPRGVSMVLDKLANAAEDMIKKGEKAPTINLCNLSVRGTNLFCVQSKGIERIKMPQMDEEQTEKFKVHLAKQGYEVTNEEQLASHLRATQNELNGVKVAGIARSLRKAAYEAPRMVVSDDDYILDGHHRWAAKVGNDSRDGILTNDTKIKISRVKISITKLLEEAHKFTGGKGAKGVGDRGFIDKDWDESQHPRGKSGPGTTPGSFTAAGGGSEGTSEKEAARTKRVLNPAVVEVGGDDWNKQTALRLEHEYQDAKPKLEEIMEDFKWGEETVEGEGESESGDDDVPSAPPESWNDLSDFHQEKVKEDYFENKKQDYIDTEIQQWHDSGGSLDAAKSELFSDSDGWKGDAIEEWITGTDDEDVPFTKTKFPFTPDQLNDALRITAYESDGEGRGSLILRFDDKVLHEAKADELEDDEQLRFEGVEGQDYSKLLTEEMRVELTTIVKVKFNKLAEEKSSEMEVPDYIEEAGEEYMKEDWDSNMTEEDKFGYAKHSTEVVNELIKEYEATGGDEGEILGVPETFDPLNETSGTDYRKTQKIARVMSIERAEQVIKERGIKFGMGAVPLKALRRIDHELWDDWKGSSTSESGQLLQVAIADELGGRLNPKTGHGGKVELNKLRLQTMADEKYGAIGGYDGIKAYVRAKWETTQFLLDQAGKHELYLYRGISLDPAIRDEALQKSEDVENYKRAPTLRIVRNGAASTSVSAQVANDWSADNSRVVLRAVIPRTAAVSVPAYGINVKSEQEVVVAGTAWKGWDAWIGRAPKLERIKLAA